MHTYIYIYIDTHTHICMCMHIYIQIYIYTLEYLFLLSTIDLSYPRDTPSPSALLQVVQQYDKMHHISCMMRSRLSSQPAGGPRQPKQSEKCVCAGCRCWLQTDIWPNSLLRSAGGTEPENCGYIMNVSRTRESLGEHK